MPGLFDQPIPRFLFFRDIDILEINMSGREEFPGHAAVVAPRRGVALDLFP